jgi:hypothetical protein
MKAIAVFLMIYGILFSCNKNNKDKEDDDIIGTWRLIEVLADPGDGSGTFYNVESNKILEFHDDGTVTSNGTLCDMSIEADEATSGTYSLSDSTFSSTDCINPALKYKFDLIDSYLVIIYPCIEPCQAKFRKVK